MGTSESTRQSRNRYDLARTAWNFWACIQIMLIVAAAVFGVLFVIILGDPISTTTWNVVVWIIVVDAIPTILGTILLLIWIFFDPTSY